MPIPPTPPPPLLSLLRLRLEALPAAPPQAFALTFFLLFSSCATLQGDEARDDVWEKTPPPQERVQTPTPPAESRAEGLDLIPGADADIPKHLVARLPLAPQYAPPPAFSPEARAARTRAPAAFSPLAVASEPDGLPETLFDDMDPDSMKQAIHRQLRVMESANPQANVRLGDVQITQARLIATLQAFDRLLDERLEPQAFSRRVRELFYILPAGLGQNRQVTFTGYYTPVISASRRWSPDFPYPLYRKPDPHQAQESVYTRAMQTHKDYGFHLIASTRPLDLTREAIDGREVLADKNLEVAWLQDDLERYFLHVQGSGYLKFADGGLEAVQYMGSNDHPYQSVGKMLIRDGVITTGQGSMQGIKRYFHEHPESIPKYLFKNKRYIFFNLSGTGPRGSGGAELVAGRSIATDKRLYPAGGLVFITAQKPLLDENDEIADWQAFSRFVLDQDTGAAIQGRGRADLYFGVGDRAGAMAGRYLQRGKMFYLVLK